QNAANWLITDAGGNLITELKGSNRSSGPLFSKTVITDGQWHRIGLVFDGSNRTLYVDGVIAAEDTQPGLLSSQMGLYIGTGQAMDSETCFSGMIDDIRIYNRVVSP
ncbi:LamG-like jellyroll fold domain-containing protein, partial [Planctomycetota bacterium]